MNKPKVSVIVPVYNTASYVEETLRSLMRQTLPELEIIAVNDGSTDQSLAVLERLAAEDPRIRVVSQSNQGLSVTRNNGIALATGEYIHFMDSDDLLEPDTYERCYARCTAENLDFVIFDADSFGTEAAQAAWFDYHRVNAVGETTTTGGELFEKLLAAKRYRASACLSFIRLDYLRNLKLGFLPGILHEDELFTPQLYLGSSRCGGVARDFFHRRVHPGSIMGARFSKRNLDGYTAVLEGLSAYAEANGEAARQSIEHLFCSLVPAVVLRAAAIPDFSTRLAFERLVRKNYRRYVTRRALLTLLFKHPLKKLIGR